MNYSLISVRLAMTLAALSVAACGGGTAGGSEDDSGGAGGGGPSTPLPSLADETTDPGTPVLSDRSAAGSAQAAYVVLEGQAVRFREQVTIDYGSGEVTGLLLSGTDLDDADYTNPAGGEHSRVVRITGSSAGNNVFGVVGIDATLPPTGTVTNYREGWVGLNAAIAGDDNYTLEGDAVFTATWDANEIDGRFLNLSGTRGINGNVSNVGTIIINNANISNDNFTGGTVTGTGLFDDVGGSGTTTNIRGTFFGPQADELGGVIAVNDSTDGIRIVGAFQAD